MSGMYEDSIRVDTVADAFAIEGKLLFWEPYGNGHINDTFLLTYELPLGEKKRYILQRLNLVVFKRPDELMKNVVSVTEYLRQMIIRQGGDPDRETLRVIKTREGGNYFQDRCGNCFRVFSFIEDSICLQQVENKDDFYACGAAFGNFQRMLADYPVADLYETIPDFHNTPSRFRDFQKAVEEDLLGRAALVQAEIDFALEREKETSELTDLIKEGKLPLRVTHNDTKLDNILFDKESKKALCIIDLDTVMPGSSLYDFGDSIRFGASTGAEDEKDLSKVELDLSLFEAFTRGYLVGSGGSLTQKEIEMLPMGAKLMTYECGIRFLADYLQGDVYFKIQREGHNLDRARTQFKLVAEMEEKWTQMNDIVRKYK